jgi:uncharacterized membrane protein HdeD (DUF308 family)
MDVVALSAHSVVAPASIEYIATASAVASSYWSLNDGLFKLLLYLFFFSFLYSSHIFNTTIIAILLFALSFITLEQHYYSHSFRKSDTLPHSS